MIDKKALKKQYKETVQPMGVFQIKNLENGKVFIASGRNIPGLFNRHRFQLKNNSHVNKALQSDYNRLGEDSFAFEVLDYLEPKDDPLYDYTKDLKTLEEMWLDKLQPYNGRGYNKKKATT